MTPLKISDGVNLQADFDSLISTEPLDVAQSTNTIFESSWQIPNDFYLLQADFDTSILHELPLINEVTSTVSVSNPCKEDSEHLPSGNASGTDSKSIPSECDSENEEKSDKDSDYVPSESELAGESDLDLDCLPSVCEPKRAKKSEKAPATEVIPKKTSKRRKKISSDVLLPIVSTAKPGKKRAYDKVHFCLFCGVKIHKISRHLELCHKNEPEIKTMPKFDPTDKETFRARQKAFELLINEGDFYYNREVLAKKDGVLILKRMPSALSSKLHSYLDYTPCPHCLAFILRRSLTDHMKTCVGISENLLEKRRAGAVEDFLSKSETLLGSVIDFSVGSEFYEKVIVRMKDDDVTTLCKNDFIIMQVGAFLYEKFENSQCEYIRQSMRMLARLLIEAQNLDETMTQIEQLFNPAMFDLLVVAVKNLCLHKSRAHDRPGIQKAALLLKLGPLIKKAASLYRGNCLRNIHKKENTEEEKKTALEGNRQTKDFLTIMELEWRTRLSSAALSSLKERKFNAGQLLPVTSDLIMLTSHINTELDAMMEKVVINNNKCTIEDYRRLSELDLTSIMLFNKKRPGDVSNMKVKDVTTRPDFRNSSEEIRSMMTPLEKQLAARMTVCDVRGKCNRRVPVILTERTKKATELLIQLRDKVGVDPKNPFLFAIANYEAAHLRAHFVLQRLCGEVALKAPHLIKGTYLRKYVATVTQIINLTENEADWLARHLGHDIRVHREFYRLHENAVEATKVSRLLLAVESGTLGKFAGKKLSDITLEGKNFKVKGLIIQRLIEPFISKTVQFKRKKNELVPRGIELCLVLSRLPFCES